MNIYLDQNKWIELARIFHGKDKSPRSISVLREFNAAMDAGARFPLSAVHYMEFSRISNDARRARLGRVMWEYSGGYTIASYRDIIRREIEVGLQAIFPHVSPREIRLIGRGTSHAFGEGYQDGMPESFNELFDRSVLVGNASLDVAPAKSPSSYQKIKFMAHLEEIQKKKRLLPRNKWEDWLYAMSITDVMKPLFDVCLEHGIEKEQFEELGKDQYRAFVEAMPTRRLDVHLHRQVIKNSVYKPKSGDLEDWSGVGVASCYLDVVVCEKHFADMLRREKYEAHARIETNLFKVFKEIGST